MIGQEELQRAAGRYRWAVITLWTLCMTSSYMMSETLGLLLPAISADLSLSPGQQGLLASAPFWTSLLLAIPLSTWVSRYGPKALTAVTLGLGVLFLFLQGWASNLGVLLLGRMGFGIGITARETARALLARQWFSSQEVTLVNGIGSALYSLIVGGGMLVTPFLLASMGNDWRKVFYTFGLFLAGLTLLWLAVGRERPPTQEQVQEAAVEPRLLRNVVRHRDLWVASLGLFGAGFVRSAFLAFFPTLMLESGRASLQASGTVLAVATLVSGAAGLAAGYLATTPRRTKAMLVALGALMVASYVGMALAGSVPLLVLLAFANGVAWGFFPLLVTVPFQLPGTTPREAAVAQAVTMTVLAGGFALGPVAVSLLRGAFADLQAALLAVSMVALALSAAGMALQGSPGEPRGI
ncbi:MAG: MFS transporter [Chloroflexi bacterium]|nr:MFS transporter [Chloroflexota bacterium]